MLRAIGGQLLSTVSATALISPGGCSQTESDKAASEENGALCAPAPPGGHRLYRQAVRLYRYTGRAVSRDPRPLLSTVAATALISPGGCSQTESDKAASEENGALCAPAPPGGHGLYRQVVRLYRYTDRAVSRDPTATALISPGGCSQTESDKAASEENGALCAPAPPGGHGLYRQVVRLYRYTDRAVSPYPTATALISPGGCSQTESDKAASEENGALCAPAPPGGHGLYRQVVRLYRYTDRAVSRDPTATALISPGGCSQTESDKAASEENGALCAPAPPGGHGLYRQVVRLYRYTDRAVSRDPTATALISPGGCSQTESDKAASEENGALCAPAPPGGHGLYRQVVRLYRYTDRAVSRDPTATALISPGGCSQTESDKAASEENGALCAPAPPGGHGLYRQVVRLYRYTDRAVSPYPTTTALISPGGCSQTESDKAASEENGALCAPAPPGGHGLYRQVVRLYRYTDRAVSRHPTATALISPGGCSQTESDKAASEENGALCAPAPPGGHGLYRQVVRLYRYTDRAVSRDPTATALISPGGCSQTESDKAASEENGALCAPAPPGGHGLYRQVVRLYRYTDRAVSRDPTATALISPGGCSQTESDKAASEENGALCAPAPPGDHGLYRQVVRLYRYTDRAVSRDPTATALISPGGCSQTESDKAASEENGALCAPAPPGGHGLYRQVVRLYRYTDRAVSRDPTVTALISPGGCSQTESDKAASEENGALCAPAPPGGHGLYRQVVRLYRYTGRAVSRDSTVTALISPVGCSQTESDKAASEENGALCAPAPPGGHGLYRQVVRLYRYMDRAVSRDPRPLLSTVSATALISPGGCSQTESDKAASEENGALCAPAPPGGHGLYRQVVRLYRYTGRAVSRDSTATALISPGGCSQTESDKAASEENGALCAPAPPGGHGLYRQVVRLYRYTDRAVSRDPTATALISPGGCSQTESDKAASEENGALCAPAPPGGHGLYRQVVRLYRYMDRAVSRDPRPLLSTVSATALISPGGCSQTESDKAASEENGALCAPAPPGGHGLYRQVVRLYRYTGRAVSRDSTATALISPGGCSQTESDKAASEENGALCAPAPPGGHGLYRQVVRLYRYTGRAVSLDPTVTALISPGGCSQTESDKAASEENGALCAPAPPGGHGLYRQVVRLYRYMDRAVSRDPTVTALISPVGCSQTESDKAASEENGALCAPAPPGGHGLYRQVVRLYRYMDRAVSRDPRPLLSTVSATALISPGGCSQTESDKAASEENGALCAPAPPGGHGLYRQVVRLYRYTGRAVSRDSTATALISPGGCSQTESDKAASEENGALCAPAPPGGHGLYRQVVRLYRYTGRAVSLDPTVTALISPGGCSQTESDKAASEENGALCAPAPPGGHGLYRQVVRLYRYMDRAVSRDPRPLLSTVSATALISPGGCSQTESDKAASEENGALCAPAPPGGHGLYRQVVRLYRYTGRAVSRDSSGCSQTESDKAASEENGALCAPAPPGGHGLYRQVVRLYRYTGRAVSLDPTVTALISPVGCSQTESDKAASEENGALCAPAPPGGHGLYRQVVRLYRYMDRAVSRDPTVTALISPVGCSQTESDKAASEENGALCAPAPPGGHGLYRQVVRLYRYMDRAVSRDPTVTALISPVGCSQTESDKAASEENGALCAPAPPGGHGLYRQVVRLYRYMDRAVSRDSTVTALISPGGCSQTESDKAASEENGALCAPAPPGGHVLYRQVVRLYRYTDRAVSRDPRPLLSTVSATALISPGGCSQTESDKAASEENGALCAPAPPGGHGLYRQVVRLYRYTDRAVSRDPTATALISPGGCSQTESDKAASEENGALCAPAPPGGHGLHRQVVRLYRYTGRAVSRDPTATALISPGGCSQTESDKAASEENGALCAPAPPGGHGLYRQVVRLYRYTDRAVSLDPTATALISPGGCSQTESDKAASEENGALCAPAPPGGHGLYRQVVRLYRYTGRAVSLDPTVTALISPGGCSQTESDKAASEENGALCAPAPPGGHGLYRQVVRLYRYMDRAVSRDPRPLLSTVSATALISPGGCSQTESDKAASEENGALCAPAPPGGHRLYRQVVRLYRYMGRGVSRDPRPLLSTVSATALISPGGCSQTESDKAASEENGALCAPAPPGGHRLYRQVVRLYRYMGRGVSRDPTATALISPVGCSQTESDKAASEENGALCAPAPPGGHVLYRQVVRLYRYTDRAVSRDPSGCSQTESDKAASEENGALCAPAPPGGHGLYRQVVRLYRYTDRAVSRDPTLISPGGCSQTESDKAASEENGALCAPAPPGGHGLYRQVVRLYRYMDRAVSRDPRPLLSTVSATALISPGGCSQTESDKAASEENGALCAPAPPGGHGLYRQVVRLYRYTDRAVSRDPTATALISPGGCSQTESDKAASEENGALCAPAPPGGHGLYRQVVRLYRYTDRAVSRDPTLISPGGCSQTESDKAASEENGALCAPAPPGGHGLYRQVVRLYRYMDRAVSRDPRPLLSTVSATALISPGGCSQTESDKAASEENGALCAPAPPGGHGLYRQVVRLYRYTDRAVSRDPTATALISPVGCSQTESDKAASEENDALCAPAPPGGHGLYRQVVRLYRYTGRAVSRDPTATALISPVGCSQTESDKAASEENGALCAPAPPGGHGLYRQVVRLYRYTDRAVSRDPTATALISPVGCSQTESDKAASEENDALCAPAPPGGHGLYRQVVRLYRYTGRAVSRDPTATALISPVGCSQTESDKAASEENGALCAPAPPGGHGLYRQVVRLYRYTDRAVSRDPTATALISPGGCSQTESDKAASEENDALCAPAPPGGHGLYRQVVRLYRYMDRAVSRDPTVTALISPGGCSQTESDKAASEENGALCAPAPPGGHGLYRQVVRLYCYTGRAVSRDSTVTALISPGGCSQTESDKAASEENGALCAPAPPGGHGLYRQVVRLYCYTGRAVSRDSTVTALISPGGCSQTESDKAASEENDALCAPAPPGGHGLYRQVVRLYRYMDRAVSRDPTATALISPGGCSQTESDKAASEENDALCAPAPPGGHGLYRQVVRLYRYMDRAVSRDPTVTALISPGGCSQTESDKAASEENGALCAPAPPGGHGLYRQVVRLYCYTGRAVSRDSTVTALISPGGCSQTESDKAASEENGALCAPAPPGGHGLYRQVVRLYCYTGRAVSRDSTVTALISPGGCSQTESDKAASEENDALCAPAPPGGHGLYRQVVRLYRYMDRAVSRDPTVTALISPGGCSQTESDKAASEENGALCAPAPPGGHGLYRQVVRLYCYTGRAVSRDSTVTALISPGGCSQTESDKAASEENGALCAPAPPGGHGLYRQVVRLYRYMDRAVSRDPTVTALISPGGCSQTESDKAASEENGALCAPAPPGGHGLYRQVVRLYCYTGRAVSRDSTATALISPVGCSQTESDKAASEENGALCAPAPPGGHGLYRQVVRLYRYTDRAVSRDPTATALISPGGCSQTESDKAASEENGALCAPAPPGGHGLHRQVVRLYRYTGRAVSRDPTATALISPGGCSQTESDKAASEENGALCAPAPPGGHGLHRQVVRLYRYTGRAVSRDPTVTALISPGGCSQTESDKAASEENGALCAPAPPGGHGLYRQVVRLYCYTGRAVSRDSTATALISPVGCSQTESDKAASEENDALCAPAPPGGHGLYRQVVRLYRYTDRAVSRDPRPLLSTVAVTALISPGGCSQTESDKAASEENGALCAPAPPGGHGLYRQVVRLYCYTGRAVSRDSRPLLSTVAVTALISPGGCSQTESDKAASEENGALCAPAPPGGHGLYRQVVRLYCYTGRAVSRDSTVTALISPGGCSQTESDKAASEENGALCAPAPPGGHGLYRQVVRLYCYTGRAVSRDSRPLLSTVAVTALISPGGCSQTESDKAASEENGALCAPAPPGGHGLYRQVVRLYCYTGRAVSRDSRPLLSTVAVTALISPGGCSQTESDKAASEENGALCAPAPPGGHGLYRQVVRLYCYTGRAVSRDSTVTALISPGGCSQTESDKAASEENGALCAPAPPGGHGLYRQVVRLYCYTGRAVSRDSTATALISPVGCSQTESDKAASEENDALCAPAPPGGHGLYRQVVRLYRYTDRAVSRDPRPLLSTVAATALISPGGCSQTESDKAASEENGALCAPAPPGGHVLYRQVVRLYRYTDRAVSRDPTATALISPVGCSQTESDKAASEENGALCAPAPPGGHVLYRQVVRLYRYTDRAVSRDPSGCSQTESDKAASEENDALCAPAPPGGHGLYRQVVRLYRYMDRAVSRDPTVTALISPGGCSQTESDKAASEENGALCAPAPPGGHGLYRQVVRLYCYTGRAVSRDSTATALISPVGCSQTESDKAASEENGALCAPAPPGGHGLYRQVVRLYRYMDRAVSRDPTVTALISPGGCSQTESDKAASEENGALCAPAPPGGHGLYRQVVRLYCYMDRAVSRDSTATALISPVGCSQTESDKAASEENGALCAPAPPGGHGLYRQVVRLYRYMDRAVSRDPTVTALISPGGCSQTESDKAASEENGALCAPAPPGGHGLYRQVVRLYCYTGRAVSRDSTVTALISPGGCSQTESDKAASEENGALCAPAPPGGHGLYRQVVRLYRYTGRAVSRDPTATALISPGGCSQTESDKAASEENGALCAPAPPGGHGLHRQVVRLYRYTGRAVSRDPTVTALISPGGCSQTESDKAASEENGALCAPAPPGGHGLHRQVVRLYRYTGRAVSRDPTYQNMTLPYV
ncbi:hypothetical protein KXD40_009075 [Peronospora effusa]|nr:hypothetical protein KXD40_009075 [Peronospora effusa]